MCKGSTTIIVVGKDATPIASNDWVVVDEKHNVVLKRKAKLIVGNDWKKISNLIVLTTMGNT